MLFGGIVALLFVITYLYIFELKYRSNVYIRFNLFIIDYYYIVLKSQRKLEQFF